MAAKKFNSNNKCSLYFRNKTIREPNGNAERRDGSTFLLILILNIYNFQFQKLLVRCVQAAGQNEYTPQFQK